MKPLTTLLPLLFALSLPAAERWGQHEINLAGPASGHPYLDVQYDATASGDNVTWWFSAPSDTPGPSAVSLDRRTAYHAGPVDGDVGPLVIGNFNETMQSFGLDRQFRGDIRDLQVFGSRVGGRGALKANEISLHSGGKMLPEAQKPRGQGAAVAHGVKEAGATNQPGQVQGRRAKSVSKWRAEVQADFAARMERCKSPAGPNRKEPA